jgi:hypothetical protein
MNWLGQLSLNDKVADVAPDLTFHNPWEDTDPVRVVTLVKTTDPLAGEVLQFKNTTLVRVNSAWMYFQYGVMFVIVALPMSTICMSVWLIVLTVSFKLKKKVYVSDSACVRF